MSPVRSTWSEAESVVILAAEYRAERIGRGSDARAMNRAGRAHIIFIDNDDWCTIGNIAHRARDQPEAAVLHLPG